jgi:hypothetical protein
MTSAPRLWRLRLRALRLAPPRKGHPSRSHRPDAGKRAEESILLDLLTDGHSGSHVRVEGMATVLTRRPHRGSTCQVRQRATIRQTTPPLELSQRRQLPSMPGHGPVLPSAGILIRILATLRLHLPFEVSGTRGQRVIAFGTSFDGLLAGPVGGVAMGHRMAEDYSGRRPLTFRDTAPNDRWLGVVFLTGAGVALGFCLRALKTQRDTASLVLALATGIACLAFVWAAIELLSPMIELGESGVRFRIRPWRLGFIPYSEMSGARFVAHQSESGSRCTLYDAYVDLREGASVQVARGDLMHPWTETELAALCRELSHRMT